MYCVYNGCWTSLLAVGRHSICGCTVITMMECCFYVICICIIAIVALMYLYIYMCGVPPTIRPLGLEIFSFCLVYFIILFRFHWPSNKHNNAKLDWNTTKVDNKSILWWFRLGFVCACTRARFCSFVHVCVRIRVRLLACRFLRTY